MINISNKNKKGFTLVEVLVSIAIFILIMLAVTKFQVSIFQSNKYTSDVITSAQDARSILRTMVQELRSAKSGSNGSYPIVQTATSSITFYSDINSDD